MKSPLLAPVLALLAVSGIRSQQATYFVSNGLPGTPVRLALAGLPGSSSLAFGESSQVGVGSDGSTTTFEFFRASAIVPFLTTTQTAVLGSESSVIVHLDAAGAPAVSVFAEDVAPRSFGGSAGVTFRNLGQFAALGVVIRDASGVVVATLGSLTNGNGASAELAPGRYDYSVFSGTTVLRSSTPLDLTDGTVRFLSVVGDSASVDVLDFARDRRPLLSETGADCGGARSIFRETATPPSSYSIFGFLTGLSASSVVALNVGIAPTSIDLTGLGASGCVVGVAPLGSFPVGNTFGFANARLEIPPAVASSGPPIYFQFVFTDAANAAGIGLSRTARLRTN